MTNLVAHLRTVYGDDFQPDPARLEMDPIRDIIVRAALRWGRFCLRPLPVRAALYPFMRLGLL